MGTKPNWHLPSKTQRNSRLAVKMEMLRFIASVAYRNPGMAASGMFSQGSARPTE
jgi:hypothetical protein